MEEWRFFDLGEGVYQASNMGRIRSVDRQVSSKKGSLRNCKGKILKQWRNNNNGYMVVYLSFHGKTRIRDVHRLIALSFCSGFEKGKQVNHKNGIKTDNRAENLEWITPSENIIHAKDTGLQHDRGEESVNSKLKTEDVLRIREMKKSGVYYKDIASIFGVHKDYVTLIVNKKRWAHVE